MVINTYQCIRFFLITLILFPVFIIRCAYPVKSEEQKILFFERHVNSHGELIQGNCICINIDFPEYYFDEKTYTLHIYNIFIDQQFEISDSLQIIYGSLYSLSGATGSGAVGGVVGIDSLPYKPEDNLEIDNSEVNGTIYLKYKGETVVLAVDQEWKTETSCIDTSDSFLNDSIKCIIKYINI